MKTLALLVVLTIVSFPNHVWKRMNHEQRMQAIEMCCEHEIEMNWCRIVAYSIRSDRHKTIIHTQCAEAL